MSGPTPGPWYVETGTPSGRRLVADLVEGDLRLTHYRYRADERGQLSLPPGRPVQVSQ